MTLPITQVALTPYDVLMKPEGGRRMDLPGFDAEFVDFPDYIIRITDWIWHERNVELCKRYYTDDCEVHTLSGDVIGAQTVTDNTHAMMEAYPDRRLEPDNVIWSDEGDEGFFSSHLITSQMTNLGPSEFGPATGRSIRVLTIADCLCRDNRIYKEWLVRDTGGMVQQLGLDVDDIAKAQAAADMAAGRSLIDLHARKFSSARGQGVPPGPEALWLASALARTLPMSGQYFDRVRSAYPLNQDFYGTGQVAAFLAQLRQAIPDVTVQFQHVCAVPYLDGAEDFAIRFTLVGTHSGDGVYGPASGAPVVIMAACHWRVINGLIHHEWMVWDDLAVRRQIWTHRLSQS